jgi:HD-like signal output (HDOD) protein
MIAKAIRFPGSEESFLAGLMHDIGKVILNLKMPDRMLEIVQEVYNTQGITFSQLEQERFGFSHAEVGQLIAKKWNFTQEIEEAIGYHHLPQEAKIQPNLAYIVNLANAFCHKLEVGPTRNADLKIEELASARVLKLDSEKIENLLEELTGLISSQQGISSF